MSLRNIQDHPNTANWLSSRNIHDPPNTAQPSPTSRSSSPLPCTWPVLDRIVSWSRNPCFDVNRAVDASSGLLPLHYAIEHAGWPENVGGLQYVLGFTDVDVKAKSAYGGIMDKTCGTGRSSSGRQQPAGVCGYQPAR